MDFKTHIGFGFILHLSEITAFHFYCVSRRCITRTVWRRLHELTATCCVTMSPTGGGDSQINNGQMWSPDVCHILLICRTWMRRREGWRAAGVWLQISSSDHRAFLKFRLLNVWRRLSWGSCLCNPRQINADAERWSFKQDGDAEGLLLLNIRGK